MSLDDPLYIGQVVKKITQLSPKKVVNQPTQIK